MTMEDKYTCEFCANSEVTDKKYPGDLNTNYLYCKHNGLYILPYRKTCCLFSIV